MTVAPRALIAESLISGAVSGVTTVQATPNSLQHQAKPWKFCLKKTGVFLSLTWAKLPAEAVHTPAVVKRVLLEIHAMAFDAGRTLNAPLQR